MMYNLCYLNYQRNPFPTVNRQGTHQYNLLAIGCRPSSVLASLGSPTRGGNSWHSVVNLESKVLD